MDCRCLLARSLTQLTDGGKRNGGGARAGSGAGLDPGDPAGSLDAGDCDTDGPAVAATAGWRVSSRGRGRRLQLGQVVDADAGDDIAAVSEPVHLVGGGDAHEARAGEPEGIPGGGRPPDEA